VFSHVFKKPNTEQEMAKIQNVKQKRERGSRQTSTPTNSVTNEFSSIKPVVTSAIIIKPPAEMWTQIQDIRKVHDKGVFNPLLFNYFSFIFKLLPDGCHILI
jgi:hypothetical protein